VLVSKERPRPKADRAIFLTVRIDSLRAPQEFRVIAKEHAVMIQVMHVDLEPATGNSA